MADDGFTEAYKEALAFAAPGAITINTLELRHPHVKSSIYMAQSQVDLELTLETGDTVIFEASPFTLTLPRKTDEGPQELSVSFENVDRKVSDFCQLAAKFTDPIELYWRPYLLSDPSAPARPTPLLLFMRGVAINATTVDGKASYADIINKKFPKELYTRDRFPGLGEP